MTQSIVWLRNDLRLADNPALWAARNSATKTTAIFIDETDVALRPIGGAARAWREVSLDRIGEKLANIGIELVLRRGQALVVLSEHLEATGANSLHWNRRYGPAERAIDARIKTELGARVTIASHMGNVLVEPWEISTGQGKPFSVYTPFWKALKNKHIAKPLAIPEQAGGTQNYAAPTRECPPWAAGVLSHWQIGEDAARALAVEFLDDHLPQYAQNRDIPAKASTSRLSPHLRFGEISPRQIWHAAKMAADREPELTGEIEKFLSELGWRDFNYHQLYHRDDISRTAMRDKYDRIPWSGDKSALSAWQTGQTGIPIIDAGMRQLWQTGFMENRVRMLTASFLTKNLLIDWRVGESWFWDCLVDADAASNPGNWQWVAGCGLDASPYFRIFNPVTQGERFDPLGHYVRKWVPEVAKLPDEYVHAPWSAPAQVIQHSRLELGKTYPNPIADLKVSRQRALELSRGL